MEATRHRLAAPLLGTFLATTLAPAIARAQTTTLVSVNSFGVQGLRPSRNVSITRDRRFAAFSSECRNIAANDTNLASDVFVRDRLTGVTDCASVDPSGAVGNDASGNEAVPRLSDDGRYVAFSSRATDLVPGGTLRSGHNFVRDRWNATTELVNVDSNGIEGDYAAIGPASISADGRYVAFTDYSTNLVPGDANGAFDVFVRDRVAATTERVSVDSSGAEGNGLSVEPSISADGRFVAFWSSASNLVVNDNNNTEDVFVHDRATGATERVSVDSSGLEGDLGSVRPSISSDGRLVAFASAATNLVAGDSNGQIDIFVHDRASGATERVSIDSSGTEANDDSWDPAISGDGNVVAFASDATNLVSKDQNARSDIFVHDRTSGATRRVSLGDGGGESNGINLQPAIDDHGRCVAFMSNATNLVALDGNYNWDCFVRDRVVAAWSNYGTGFPGTNGIPSFTARADPILGTTVTLDLANSWGSPTIGVLLAGVARASIPTNRGGDLLVDALVVGPIAFGAGDVAIDWDVPNDVRWEGLAVDAQALEADPGAAKGVSFTAGLELTLGF